MEIDYANIDDGGAVYAAQRLQRKQTGLPTLPRALVLLIDDSPVVAKALGEVLGDMGLDTIVARDGRQGLELYRERGNEIGLVMLDMNMPRMNGEQTLKALREIDPDVNVLIATSANEGEVRRRCEEQGVAVPHYLQKIGGIGSVVEKVQMVLGQQA